MIKYTLLKSVQISAIIILPLLAFNNLLDESYGWTLFDLFVLYTYTSDLINKTLEKKLHNELY